MARWHLAARKELPDWIQIPWPWWQGFVVLGAWLGLQFAIGIGISLIAPYSSVLTNFVNQVQGGQQLQAQVAAYLLEVLAGVLAIGFYMWRYKVGIATLGIRKFNVVKMLGYFLALGVVFFLGVQLILLLVTVLVPHFNANQAQSNGIISNAKQQPLLAIVTLVVLPPILEETLFRGFMFPTFSKKVGLVWGAILSSALFGIAHWQANISVYTFVLGLVLCFMYVKLKSTVPGMFLHMLNNYVAFLAMFHK